MYFAIQARNIVEEKSNHRYYRLYKRYVRRLNRDLTWKIKWGRTRSTLRAPLDQPYLDVFEQIANEMRQYGYTAEVRQFEGNQTNPHSYSELIVRWG